MLAACGVEQVPGVLSCAVCSDFHRREIVAGGQALQLGQIRDINRPGLSAMIAQWGGQVAYQAIVKDDREALLAAMTEGLQQADVLLTSGGSSVGERDYTYQLMQELCHGDVFIKGIAVKPGKPTIAGKAGDKLILGLPGHPGSGADCISGIDGRSLKAMGYGCAGNSDSGQHCGKFAIGSRKNHISDGAAGTERRWFCCCACLWKIRHDSFVGAERRLYYYAGPSGRAGAGAAGAGPYAVGGE